MTQIPVSVVVVSRGRPQALTRCLTGLSQLYYDNFEVVVVADLSGHDAVSESSFAEHVKLVAFDEANISVARNLGIAQAAGEIVAFIDDDAVPEPTWLAHLAIVFEETPSVAAAGGFVRGRNGISFQWTARSVDNTGQSTGLHIDGNQPVALTPANGKAIKTEGTNMAFRRSVLSEMGGFDPAFRYYLDETDLNVRLAKLGCKTAIVPLAEVHHGFGANAIRDANRAPRDLFEIGASQEVFLRKHCEPSLRKQVWKDFADEQRKRVLRYMVAGHLEPAYVRYLLRRLEEGRVQGETREIPSLAEIPRSPTGLKKFPTLVGNDSIALSGRSWRRRHLQKQSREIVNQGRRASLFVFSPTALYHRVRFTKEGIWEQKGGIFGRSDRSQPLFKLMTFAQRVRMEKGRVAELRRLIDE